MVAVSLKRGKHSSACPSLPSLFLSRPDPWRWTLPLWHKVGLHGAVICSCPALLLCTCYVWNGELKPWGYNSKRNAVPAHRAWNLNLNSNTELLAPFDSADLTLHFENIPAVCSSHTPTGEQKNIQNGCSTSYRNSDTNFLVVWHCIVAHCFRSQARPLPEEGREESHLAPNERIEKSTGMYLPIAISLHVFLCLYKLKSFPILCRYLTFARFNWREIKTIERTCRAQIYLFC